MYAVARADADNAPLSPTIEFEVLDQDGWEELAPVLAAIGVEKFNAGDQPRDVDGSWKEMAEKLAACPHQVLVYCLPRGVGPTEWSRNERTRTHIRRRFMQLGQTAAAMQIWDVRRALRAIDQIPAYATSEREMHAAGDAAVWSLYASLWEPRIVKLTLEQLPPTNRQAPDLLNVSRIVEMPQLLLMAADHSESIDLVGDSAGRNAWKTLRNSGLAAAKKIRFTAMP
jgi:hypothetical protein